MPPQRSRRRRRPSPSCANGRKTPATAIACGRAFSRLGPQALPDYELLELLLFFSIDVKDTKPLAKELLARYGSLGGVLNAEPAQLAEFHDLHKESAEIDGYLAYRAGELYQRDREAEMARCPMKAAAGAPSSRSTRTGGRSCASGAGARPRFCSR